MGNFKKMILGEEMPDKDDPKYKEKYYCRFFEICNLFSGVKS